MASCFVIMPFRPELDYLYLALKDHLHKAYPTLLVERGDEQFLTRPLLDKIAMYIRQADVLIADCSGRNPNVFYELGMAHALDKPVILITAEPIEAAPADIRAFEFMSYAKHAPSVFLEKLDAAMAKVLGDPYAGLYPEALQWLDAFKLASGLANQPVAESDFRAAMRAAAASGKLLPPRGRLRKEFLIRRLIERDPEINVLIALKNWLETSADA